MAAIAEVNRMKREESLLNLTCLIVAAGFFALIAYNLFAAGTIISTDGLFFTVVFLVLALSFLSVPAMDIAQRRLASRALARGDAPPQQMRAGSGAPAALRGAATPVPKIASAPALKDARGRAMPPDVNRMMAEMNAPSIKKTD